MAGILAQRRERAGAIGDAEPVADLLALLLLLAKRERGPEAHAAILVARALGDRPREEAAAQRAHELGDHALAAGGLPEDGDAPRVAAEGGDVAAHPPQGRLLVQEPVVAGDPAGDSADSAGWARNPNAPRR